MLDLMLPNKPQRSPRATYGLLRERFSPQVWCSAPPRSLQALVACFAVLGGCHEIEKPDSVSGKSPAVQRAAWTGHTMGTTYRIAVWFSGGGGADALDQTVLEPAVAERLEQINQRMSTYRPDSELSRFNVFPANRWFSVSAETADVVAAALHYHKATEGALDVTIGPLMRLWGFNPQRPQRELGAEQPEPEEIQEVLTRVGAEHLHVRDNDRSALQKTVEGLEVDLSAIAKGHAVDQIVALLQQAGGEGGLVEIGGEVRTWGHRSDGRLWRVGIENPRVQNRMLAQIIGLQDAALATSGDYRNFRSIEGQRICHLIDPVTGRPRPTRPMSVSVCAKTCIEADALATALFLLGPEKGLAWSENHGVAAMFLTVKNGKMVQKHSSRFESYLQ